ncbi:UTP--glucose-1-phosphate uridylyltransferase [Lignipirellula cremea]|uniref:Putative uridylyltransferase n=1 Tax=Lignipirellula cremea TaxID=2528010 RepID=A0A518DQW7_9BACT|nr:UTP--glucose-1-phosphate uridylyltransferase [Lignipirellula cremea]QDU94236.1 putative uridylyltransferase [Lignipirellula cremea]
MKKSLLQRLQPTGNAGLLALWDTLAADQQQELARQIAQVDFERIAAEFQAVAADSSLRERSERAQSPPAFRLEPQASDRFTRSEARDRGEAALGEGRLAMILVAGGQGSRLGFDHPKGMFPVGAVSGRTLFQILIEGLQAVGRRYGTRIPLLLMTSHATHQETLQFLDAHQRFGLPEEDLRVFQQGSLPAIDAQTGRVLLESPGSLCLSPDGHGGMLQALHASGGLAFAEEREIEQFFYGQVDNPMTQICDPELIGYHLLCESEMTTQVVRKQDPLERVGNVVLVDGQVQIIEYSDLPDEVAQRRDASGDLQLWAGNIAVHVFDRAFLQRQATSGTGLPFHAARKKVAWFDPARGEQVLPEEPNAIKLERFIFDLLPAARNAIVVEAKADEAFAPVKNAPGEASHTPELAQEAMTRMARRWLEAAGARIQGDPPLEISPLFALDADELKQKLPPGRTLQEPTYFH